MAVQVSGHGDQRRRERHQAGDRPTRLCLVAEVADQTGAITTIVCPLITIQPVA
jgi:hypothetical protein